MFHIFSYIDLYFVENTKFNESDLMMVKSLKYSGSMFRVGMCPELFVDMLMSWSCKSCVYIPLQIGNLNELKVKLRVEFVT